MSGHSTEIPASTIHLTGFFPCSPLRPNTSHVNTSPFVVPRWAAIRPGLTRAAYSHLGPYGRCWAWRDAENGDGSTSLRKRPGGEESRVSSLVCGGLERTCDRPCSTPVPSTSSTRALERMQFHLPSWRQVLHPSRPASLVVRW